MYNGYRSGIIRRLCENLSFLLQRLPGVAEQGGEAQTRPAQQAHRGDEAARSSHLGKVSHSSDYTSQNIADPVGSGLNPNPGRE